MNGFQESSKIWLPGLLAMAGLVLGSAFFSSGETAYFYLSREELRRLRSGSPRQRMIVRLLSDPDRLLTAILFWNLLINLMYFATSLIVARRLIAANHSGVAGLFGLGSLGFIIIAGEVIPKSLAVVFRERLAVLFVWPMSLAVRALDPIMPGLVTLTRGIRRALWPNLKYERYLNAEDLERALESIPREQGIDESEREVLHRILDLSDVAIEEIMRPRGTYPVCRFPIRFEELEGTFYNMDYLFLQAEAVDVIDGTIPLGNLSDLTNVDGESAVLPVVHVPWCATLADTLQTMHEQQSPAAVIVNEYGETIGVVTEEDILDTVLAPQPSRTRRILRREPVLEVGEQTYHVEGMTTLRYLAARLGVDFEPEEGELVTVRGLFLEKLERFPVVGDRCEWEGWQLRVFDRPGPNQVRVLVSRLDQDAENGSDASSPHG